MITVIGLATSNEQGVSAIKDLKNRNLIEEGSISSYKEKKILNSDVGKNLLDKSLSEDKYLVVLQCGDDSYIAVKELAEGLHGLDQISKI